MAHVSIIETQVSVSEYFSFVGKKLASDFAKNRVYRQTFNELSQLSNAELNDIGVSRSGIRAIALESAYGK